MKLLHTICATLMMVAITSCDEHREFPDTAMKTCDILCTDGKVVSASGTMLLAAENAVDQGYPVGSFAVLKCISPGEEEVAYFHTPRVDFSRSSL